MRDKEFITLSKQGVCPVCRSDNTKIYRHPDNDNCRVLFCNDCNGYPAICSNLEQVYISEDIRVDYAYCKVCGDRELSLKDHALAYPDL